MLQVTPMTLLPSSTISSWAQLIANALGHQLGLRQCFARQNHNKLLPAHAAQHILGAQHGLCAAHKGLQHLVAIGMAVQVIDLFEVIQINHQQHHGLAFATHALQAIYRPAPTGRGRLRAPVKAS